MSADAHEHEAHPVSFYLKIAAFLALVTLIELGPLFEWFNLPVSVLLVLSAMKFFIVVAFFMHLWDDDKAFAQLFGYPLVGAILMVIVLMSLFYTFKPSSLDDSFAIQERYWQNYNGECSSWLVSHRSNRPYCASPGISNERLALLMPVRAGGAGAGAAPSVDFEGMSPQEQTAYLMERGEEVYAQSCQACHQAEGQGIPGAFPPLVGAGEYYGDPVNHARIIIHGLSGPIVVLGQSYNGAMPPQGSLSNLDVAAVATYERSSWGNADGVVTPADAAAAR